MNKTMLACALACATFSAAAKDKMIPLAAEEAEALKDKKVALTVHERPSFSAMTAGKVQFGLFGVAAMVAAGNKLVDENHVPDPAEIVRTNLAAALRDAHGANLLEADTTPTKAKNAKELAALHPEADYVLDVRSGGWMYAYYPTKWGKYWVGYSVQVQLVDTRTGRQVSNAACNSNTREKPYAPTRDQLHAHEAQLLKDVTASLGWTCVHLLAKDQFHFTPEAIAAIPAEYADPLATIGANPDAAATPTGEAGQVPTGTSDSGPEQASAADDQTTPAAADGATSVPAATSEAVVQPEADASSPAGDGKISGGGDTY